ncbi:TetR/AcrR family transcriptional regulator [Desertimonas flava]|jgi:AcrR family transcriptional regulator|uniref:TetR/AcrR family transcriptional regulator n=1 Tax=Desertimonas flava TaxID=2064846 RepID=UPI000E34D146|nr:TetR/AcrR family transcriptional regulator [Desertimonas flava]
MTTRKGRATRLSFQEAARRVFARDGYLNSRLSDIADEAGKSMASFYNYFESKEALLAELAADFDAELQRRVAEPFRRERSPEAALHGAIAAFYRHYQTRLPEAIGIFQASMVNPDFAAQWREIRTNGVRTIALGIRRAQAAGFAPGLDPLLAASALSSMIEHFCWVWMAGEGDATGVEPTAPGFDEHAIDTLWQLWSHAVYWTEQSPRRESPKEAT